MSAEIDLKALATPGRCPSCFLRLTLDVFRDGSTGPATPGGIRCCVRCGFMLTYDGMRFRGATMAQLHALPLDDMRELAHATNFARMGFMNRARLN